MKTLIGIPCMATVPYEFALSMLYLIKGQDVAVMMNPNSLVSDSRNLISMTAIEKNFDRVMWFDSDMVPTVNAMMDLAKRMDDNPEIDMVSGLYVRRTTPVCPVIYQTLEEPVRNKDGKLEKQIEPYWDYPKNQFFEIAGCGFGCVMTSVRLLKDVWDSYGPAFAQYAWAGEDLSFCYRAKKLGYRIYCDSSVTCGHVGTHVYTEDDLKRGGEIG